MFNFGQPQQPAGLNLSVTGAPTGQAVQGLGLGAQPQQPAGFMGGLAGGMGMQQQYGQAQQFAQQPMLPPSEMELMNALLQSQNPIHRFIASGGLASLIDLIATTTSLTLMNVLKNATFAIDDDEGGMKLDIGALPDNLKTLSAENVSVLLNQIVSSSQQTLQQADMQRQQILAMAQQSMMGGALQAALADEGTMEKIGGGIGSVARSFMGLPKQ
tara:strand:+ start:1300 stop:1944 length:645 start_codon:yes stop_codon:yes gene_type:complete